MIAERITIRNHEGRERPLCGNDQVVLASAAAPWTDLVKVERHRIDGGEIIESAATDLLLAQRLAAPENIEYRLPGERWRRALMGRGDLSLVSAPAEFSMRWKNPAEILVVAVDAAFVRTIVTQTCGSDRMEVPFQLGFRDLPLQHIMAALEAEIAEGCPAGRLFGESLAAALTVRVARRYAILHGEQSSDRPRELPAAKLRRVTDYIHAHLPGNTSLRELALMVDLSPNYFAALFKTATGISPHQFVLRQRIEMARKLLSNSRHSLAGIARETGFPTQAHFTATFRRMIGTSPARYRAESK